MEVLYKITDYWGSGGVLLIPIGVVCFLIWSRLLGLRAELLDALSSPIELGDRIKEHIMKGEGPDELCRWLAGVSGMLARVASYVLKNAESERDVRRLLDECRQAELPHFDRDLLIVAAMVSSAPLLGLPGTVLGMIGTFLAVSGRGAGTANMISGGISQALITTQFGLITALPGVFGLVRLRQMYNQLKVRFAMHESHLILAGWWHNALSTK